MDALYIGLILLFGIIAMIGVAACIKRVSHRCLSLVRNCNRLLRRRQQNRPIEAKRDLISSISRSVANSRRSSSPTRELRPEDRYDGGMQKNLSELLKPATSPGRGEQKVATREDKISLLIKKASELQSQSAPMSKEANTVASTSINKALLPTADYSIALATAETSCDEAEDDYPPAKSSEPITAAAATTAEDVVLEIETEEARKIATHAITDWSSVRDEKRESRVPVASDSLMAEKLKSLPRTNALSTLGRCDANEIEHHNARPLKRPSMNVHTSISSESSCSSGKMLQGRTTKTLDNVSQMPKPNQSLEIHFSDTISSERQRESIESFNGNLKQKTTIGALYQEQAQENTVILPDLQIESSTVSYRSSIIEGAATAEEQAALLVAPLADCSLSWHAEANSLLTPRRLSFKQRSHSNYERGENGAKTVESADRGRLSVDGERRSEPRSEEYRRVKLKDDRRPSDAAASRRVMQKQEQVGRKKQRKLIKNDASTSSCSTSSTCTPDLGADVDAGGNREARISRSQSASNEVLRALTHTMLLSDGQSRQHLMPESSGMMLNPNEYRRSDSARTANLASHAKCCSCNCHYPALCVVDPQSLLLVQAVLPLVLRNSLGSLNKGKRSRRSRAKQHFRGTSCVRDAHTHARNNALEERRLRSVSANCRQVRRISREDSSASGNRNGASRVTKQCCASGTNCKQIAGRKLYSSVSNEADYSLYHRAGPNVLLGRTIWHKSEDAY